MLPFSAIEVFAALLALCALHRLITKSKFSRPFPPGPKGWPVIGNLLDLPRSQEWKTYSEWSDRWGDVMSVTALGQRIIVLGSLEASLDLLDKRSAIYSDRPYLALTGDIVGHQRTIPLCPYGDRMKKLRRLFTKTLGTRQLVQSFEPTIQESVQDFLLNLIKSPEDFREHILLMTGANALLLSHGHRVKGSGDPILQLANIVAQEFALLGTPGRYFVDYLPFLQYIPSWVPGTGWKKDARVYRQHVDDAVMKPYEVAKRVMDTGTGNQSFCSRNLQENDGSPDHEDCIQYGAMAMFVAGSDTVASSLTSFVLAMTLYPEVQARAQSELDAVVGTDRLPEFSDQDSLPYVQALCSEVLRWLPATPLALSHKTTEDDVYKGFFIPKGSIVLPNSWRLLHDPKLYNNPAEFKPERFLSENGKKPELDPKNMAFGYGRRICPGMLVAEATIFITIATTLAAFSISPIEKGGKPILPSAGQTNGLISHPVPFQCNIKTRSTEVEKLIRSAVELR